MSGRKTFTNHSNFDLSVTLLIRQGNDITKPSLEQSFELDSKQKDLVVTYGNDQNIYLNGLIVEWKDPSTQSLQSFRQEVIATGVKPTFDWQLNTHSKIAINNVENLNITATN